jgi:hypothetical protein
MGKRKRKEETWKLSKLKGKVKVAEKERIKDIKCKGRERERKRIQKIRNSKKEER